MIFEQVTVEGDVEKKKESTNEAALLLIDDLCNLAAGSPATWLQSPVIPQHFALELVDFVIANKTEIFHSLEEFAAALRDRICHVLQQLLTETFEMDVEPFRSGTHKSTFKVLSSLLSKFYTLIPGKIAQIWHPLCAGAASHSHLWRQILCLQVLKTCVAEPNELYYLYEMYDLARDFDILAVSRVVDVAVELLRPRKRSIGGEEDRKMPALVDERVSTPASNSAEEHTDEGVACLLALEILLKITNAIHMLSEKCIETHAAQGITTLGAPQRNGDVV